MLPNGPKSALLQMFTFRDPFPAMRALATKYGDPVTVPVIGNAPFVITWDPEGIQTILSADPNTYRTSANDAISVLLGKGSIFLLDGAAHKQARRLLMPPFHGERMRAYGEIMRAVTLRHTAAWTPGHAFKAVELAQRITLDIIVEAIFGVREGVERFHEAILATVGAFSPLIAVFTSLQRDFWGMGPWARFQRHAKALRALMQAEIDAKRASPGNDILSLLVAARDETGAALSDSDILDQLLTFVVAGHETTATSLAWALYLLHQHPEALARLQAELASAGPEPSPEALAALPYTTAVCQETLRLYPPVPVVSRKLAQPLTLKGFELPAGVNVGLGVYLAHQRPDVFPEPLSFRPERFLGRTFSPFEYLPFGGGHRRCLGAAFALYEMKIVLASLLARHQLQLHEPRPVRSVDRIATYGPETGIRMSFDRWLPGSLPAGRSSTAAV